MVSFIIINYKNEFLLLSCIESVRKNLSQEKFEIIVFNNDSEPLSAIGNDADFKIIENGINIGFGKGCNEASRKASGEYLFFLNPDTEIISGKISDIVSVLKDDYVGAVAPEIISPDGELEKWSFGKSITPLKILSTNIFPGKHILTSNIDWLSGAAFVIRKDLFLKLGGFDESFFMYFEDVDLCKRILDTGLKLKRCTSFRVKHFGGKSFSNKKAQKSFYYQSQDIYIKKHFGCIWFLIIKTLRFFHK